MSILRAILKKEFLVVSRDIHSMAVLFIMPALFILVMSLAMRDLFQIHTRAKISVLAVNLDEGKRARTFFEMLDATGAFAFVRSEKEIPIDRLADLMYEKDYKFAIVAGTNFTARVESRDRGEDRCIDVLVNPTVSGQTQAGLKSAVANAFGRLRLLALLEGKDELLAYAGIDKKLITRPPEEDIGTRYAYRKDRPFVIPNSVQQNVPAWLIFSMFFIVIPVSNAFIAERNFGTLMRLRSMNVSRGHILFGKIVPYFIINIVQVIIMFLIGMYVVPLLGGEALALGGSLGGLALIVCCLSLCAISLALLVATISNTTEQATVIGGVGNIILGAVGGIMVPKFVMPDFMQRVANISPMSWGLEGFLDILLRGGNMLDVIPESLLLVILAALSLVISSIALRRKLEGGL